MPSDGKNRYGQLYTPEYDVEVPFVEQEQGCKPGEAVAAFGDAHTEIIPTDVGASLVKTFDVDALWQQVKGLFDGFPGSRDLRLPPELLSVGLTYSSSVGDGSNVYPSATVDAAAAVSGGAGVHFSPRSTAQASAAIIPDIQPDIRETWSADFPTQNYTFFMPPGIVTYDGVRGRVTRGAVTPTTITITIASPGVVTWTAHGFNNGREVTLTTTGALPTGLPEDTILFVVNKSTNAFQLSLTSGGAAINTSGTQSGVHSGRAAVLKKLVFRPVSHQITLTGEKVSISSVSEANAEASFSASGSLVTSVVAMHGQGGGVSREVGIDVVTKTIPACIHGTVSIGTADSPTTTVTVSTSVSTPAISLVALGAGGTAASTSVSITASISTGTLSQTLPTTAIPISGVYLWATNVAANFYGLRYCVGEIVDFSYLA